MMTNIELTDAGAATFNAWFDSTAKAGTSREAIVIKLMNVLANRVESGDPLTYELPGQHTLSGRPEMLMLTPDDIEVTDEPGE